MSGAEHVKLTDSAVNRCLEGYISADAIGFMAVGIAGYPKMGESLDIIDNPSSHAVTIREDHGCILASRILFHQIEWHVRDASQAKSIPCTNCLHAQAVLDDIESR